MKDMKDMKDTKRPDCHPDKSYYARKLCTDCYHKKWRKGELINVGPRKSTVQAACHQNRPVAYRQQNYGLCGPCLARMRGLVNRGVKCSLEEIAAFFIRQKRKCEFCGSTKKVVVDHSHETGYLRGELCTKCNLSLGQIERLLSNFITFKDILSYLERDPNFYSKL